LTGAARGALQEEAGPADGDRPAEHAVAVAAAVALTGARASPAGTPPIRVSVSACPSTPFSVEAFLDSLQVELAGHVPPCCLLDRAPPSPEDDPPAGVRVTLSLDPCDESAASVEVRVRDPAHPASLERRVGLSDIPVEARARALALAVAELVHSASVPPPAAPPPPPSALARAGELGGAPRPRVPWLFLSGILEIETHPGHNLTLWGVRPSVAVARGRWQAALDVEAMAGDPSVALGDVRTRLLAGTLAAGPRWSLGPLIVDLAACGRLGWAWMAGHTDDANAVASAGSASFASVAGRLGLFLPVAAQVSHLRALVEAGAMIRGLDATVDGTTASDLTGGYVLFGLGFGGNR
jgi:hypothetical protein